MPTPPPARVTASSGSGPLRPLLSSLPSNASCLKPDTVHGAVNFGFAEHLRDHVTDGGVLFQVDGFAAETTSLGETFINHVADDDRGRPSS